MGITIHYRGRLDDVGRMRSFIEDAAARAGGRGWRLERLSEEAPWVRGLVVMPREHCEPLCFLFSREGVLRHLIDLAGGAHAAEPRPWVFVKTQFAGPETHAAIIEFLQWAKANYISDLEVEDEGEYWETGNGETLRARMGAVDRLIREVVEKSRALGSPVRPEARPEDIADELIESLGAGPPEPVSDDQLRRQYGKDIIISRAGPFNFVHLDRPSPATVQRRLRRFDPRKEFPDDCALCRMMREQGTTIVYG